MGSRLWLGCTLGFSALFFLAACGGEDGPNAEDPGDGSGDAGQDGGSLIQPGGGCTDDAQCTGRCVSSVCAEPTHTDGKKNLDETDIDCGGATAPACVAGQTCAKSDDCAGLCTANVCAEPTHADGKKNLDETDVDCGGASADACLVGKTCAANTDCNLGYCATGVCAAPRVDDGIKNGTETDVDCGGAAQQEGELTIAPPRCDVTKACLLDGDCASSVCSDSKVCVEAPSCRPLRGGATCGVGETGQANAVHESCCKTLPVPGMTLSHQGANKQVYVDKYEITAGRVREWVRSIRAQYGEGNVRAWVTERMAQDPLVSSQLSAHTAYLPSKEDGESYPFPKSGGGTTSVDIGMRNQIGPTSYYRGPNLGAPNATSGCGMYAGSYGHRTYWLDDAERAYFSEPERPASTTKDLLDEKSMNCLTPTMYAAFCAWDGGYLVTRAAAQGAYGAENYPWGSQAPRTDPQKRANVNDGVDGFSPTNPPRYVFPDVNYASFAQDFTPVIAAPGRFPLDVSPVRDAADSWMDWGGNMIEIVNDGTAFKGYAGGSWEGHQYGRAMDGTVLPYDKYGKTGARCMRLR